MPSGRPQYPQNPFEAPPPSRHLGSRGHADDDPSGITTYSIVGAQYGTAMLWTSWLTWRLMATVQFMCARVGMVS